ncbi:dihydroorotate dehydrogenase (quinone) [Pelagibacteraceae bacterium]|nr:dihydroorotate dehydrogenase (quinone) [Pelagibacteraceae bacterium]
MFSKFRSLIFKFDPETAHNLAIKSLKLNLLPNLSNQEKDDSLFKTKLFGKEINNPIGIAAGFDKNAEVYNSLFKLGFGFVEVGTVTPLEQYGNPKPRVFRLVDDQALINRLGFNNLGSENISKRIKSNPNKGLLGVNIGPNKDSEDRLNDYLIGLRVFHDIADYVTINISSPNTENLRNFHDKSKFDELMDSIEKEKIRLKSKIPIIVKISPDILEEQIEIICKTLIQYKVSAIIVSNTSAKNRDKLKDILKHQKGGLSGKPLEEEANKLISKFYKILNGKIEIIGVGVVPQEINLDPFFSPRKLLDLQAGLYGVKEKDRITDTILNLVSLEKEANSYARSLSGGMKRRLLMAKALVHQPPLVFLDEPTAGVDVELRQNLWKNVRMLNKLGVTIILTTHYLEEAEKMCDRIAILNKGNVVALDSTKNLLNRIQTKKVTFKTDKEINIQKNDLESLEIISKIGNEVCVSYEKSKVNMEKLINLIKKNNVKIVDISTDDGDLEDVFLRLIKN